MNREHEKKQITKKMVLAAGSVDEHLQTIVHLNYITVPR